MAFDQRVIDAAAAEAWWWFGIIPPATDDEVSEWRASCTGAGGIPLIYASSDAQLVRVCEIPFTGPIPPGVNPVPYNDIIAAPLQVQLKLLEDQWVGKISAVEVETIVAATRAVQAVASAIGSVLSPVALAIGGALLIYLLSTGRRSH
jgi:hypothetical protein